jgi:hypothetical protein
VPTKFELIINLKTANALGIELPMGLMLGHDQRPSGSSSSAGSRSRVSMISCCQSCTPSGPSSLASRRHGRRPRQADKPHAATQSVAAGHAYGAGRHQRHGAGAARLHLRGMSQGFGRQPEAFAFCASQADPQCRDQ